MATCDLIQESIKKSVDFINEFKNNKIDLKAEQYTAVTALLNQKDVIAVLPTGFGKSLIFTLFVLAKETLKKNGSTCLVISPLKSIVVDQIAEMEGRRCSAVELTDKNMMEVANDPPQFIYCSAEQALSQSFQTTLKNRELKLYGSLDAIAVDESHVVETWTGKRKGNKDEAHAFRSDFGKLSVLRSLCKEGIPVVALTGTADAITQKTICKELLLNSPVQISISPNRTNLRFSVKKVPKDDMLLQLDWVVDMVKEHGLCTPKTIIFCNSLYAIAQVTNYIIMKLGKFAFSPELSRKREHCIVGIFHSFTQQVYKDRIMNAMKSHGIKRIIIATSALSMGVNFPDIRYVLIYGPSRSLLDILQEAGRAGRDGLPADVIITFYGQQLAHCDDEVKEFLKCESCYRVGAYRPFDNAIQPLLPSHSCCNLCSVDCLCSINGDSCSSLNKIFETISPIPPSNTLLKERDVTSMNKEILNEALYEMMNNLSSQGNVLGNTCGYGFSEELIKDVVDNCHKLFSIHDITTLLPIFSRHHASMILELLDEIFGDIDETSLVEIESLSSSSHFEVNLEEILASEYLLDEIDTENDWI